MKVERSSNNQQENIGIMGVDDDVVVMMEDDNNGNDDDGGNNKDATATTSKRRHDVVIPPRSLIATFGIMSVVYTIWFIVELIRDGNRSDWQFNIPGLMETIALELIVLMVLLLSILGFWPQHTMKCRVVRNCTDDDVLMLERIGVVLYYVSAVLGLVAAFMFFWLYVPLQSSSIVWFVRWIPWAAVSLVAFFVPFCGPSSD